MSIFSNILHKIVAAAGSAMGGSAMAGEQQPSAIAPGTSEAAAGGGTAAVGDDGLAVPAVTAGGGDAPSVQDVDVGATLSALASSHGGGGNWQSSIVDLLKLLDLDSSMSARHTLAEELNVHAGADGTAEQNMALHKAVMDKIAANGGKVPSSMG